MTLISPIRAQIIFGIVLLAIPPNGYAQVAPGIRVDEESSPRDLQRRTLLRKSYNVEHAGPAIDMHIFVPIQPAELQIYESLLQASPEQQAFIERSYDDYLIEGDALRTQWLTPFWKQAGSLDLDVFLHQDVGMNHYSALMKERDRVMSILSAHEDQFFNNLLPILDESQIPALQQVSHQRQRLRDLQQCRMVIIGSEVDLMVLLHAVHADFPEHEMMVHHRDALRIFMQEYDERLTSLMNRYRKTFHSSVRRCTVLELSGGRDHRQGLVASYDLETLNGLRRKYVDIAVDMINLTRRYYPLFLLELEEPVRSQFIRTYRAAVYWMLFDDSYDLRPLFTTAHILESLQSDQREALDLAERQYFEVREMIEEEMRTLHLDYNTKREITMSRYRPFTNILADQLEVLEQRRREHTRQTMEAIQAILSPEQWSGMEEDISILQEALTTPIVRFDERMRQIRRRILSP